jgi:cytochrome P450/ferredoxin-NADP reductase
MTLTSESPRTTADPLITPVTVYYDPLSYAVYDHPYEIYRQLRDHAPVYFNERRNLWVVSRYADVQACLRNHDQLVNKFGNDIDGTHDSYGVGFLVCQDPPRHTVLRDAVRRSFGGKEILALEGHIRTKARTLLADFKAGGGGEFVAAVILPLVFEAALRLVGVSVEETPHFADEMWRVMARTVGQLGVPEDAQGASQDTEERLAAIVAARRTAIAEGADPNTPDAISQILLSVERGRVDPAEVIGLAHLVLSAATDAPAALLSNCVEILTRYPQLQGHLAQHPDKIANFIEEVLRFDSPAQNLSRQTVAEVTIAGVTIPANARVMVLMASANRDERVFTDPDTFDVDRVFTAETKLLTFGEGIHSCMGAPLARLTARVLLEELLDGTEVRIVGTPQRWVKQMVRGFSRLPLEVVHDAHEPLTGAERHHSTKLTLTSAVHELETPAMVASKVMVSDGVVALTLRTPDDQPLAGWEPGAHVDLILDGAPARQYSLCGDPDDVSSYRLGILRDENGRGSSLFVHDRLHEGDAVRIRGPRNNFPLVAADRYVFIAGGIGITPILTMVRQAAAAGADWRLVYGGRTRASMAFLDELAGYGDRVRVCPQDEVGLLDLASLLGTSEPETLVYCCGPEPLLNAVESACAGWPEGALHVERFVAKPLSEPVLKAPFEVHLARTDLTLTVDPGTSILDAIDAAGVPVLSSCGEGTCGTCETTVLDGEPDHRDSVLDAEARRAGDCMMICVSRSCTPRLVLDL